MPFHSWHIYAWLELRRVKPHEIALKANELEIKDNLVLELKIFVFCFCGKETRAVRIFNLLTSKALNTEWEQ